MADAFDPTTLGMELDKRLDELIAWIIDRTECEPKPTFGDFAQARAELHRIAAGEPSPAAEPEEGGAQYINDNPAPWP